MITQDLKNSIENLYRVFAGYPLRSVIEGCPHCVGERDERALHDKPLRQLTGAELSFYGFKAMTTFGGVEDFKHFLPRLFEIMLAGDFAYSEEILFDKLCYADWLSWDEQEKAALEGFFRALFRFAVGLEKDEAFLTATYLVGIALAVEDVTPYLELWLADIDDDKISNLRYFVVEEWHGMSNAFLANRPRQRLQIQNWLVSEPTVSALENLFYGDDCLGKNPELPELLEAIYELQNSLPQSASLV